MSNFRRQALIPAAAITDPRVKPQALRVLAMLSLLAGEKRWCKASQVQVAKRLASSRGSVQRAINQLKAAGYLDVRNRTQTDRGPVYQPWDAHTYHILAGAA